MYTTKCDAAAALLNTDTVIIDQSEDYLNGSLDKIHVVGMWRQDKTTRRRRALHTLGLILETLFDFTTVGICANKEKLQ